MQLATVTQYPITPLKMPFAGRAKIDESYKYSSLQAGGGVNVSNLPQDGNTVANIELGFPEVFSTPITKNGKYLKRADVNALGYISTIMAYRYQMGLPNEWNSDICNAVGGYPKNAVLDYCERDGSGIITETYKITSLVDNNITKPNATVIKEAKFWRRVSINAEYVNTEIKDNNEVSTQRTFTPLIDWDYENPTTSPTGSSCQWKGFFTNHNSYRSIYDDGRYARYVYPLKQPFTDFDELMICFPDSSGGTPDQDTRIFKADVFDFLLKFPINKNIPRFDTVNTPDDPIHHYNNLWIPYDGSSLYPEKQWYAKSTTTRLVNFYSVYWSFPILEIYGIK